MQMSLSTPLIAVWNETRKGLLLNWSYRFNTLAEIISMTFIFIGILFFIGDGELKADRMAPALIGYVIWFFAMSSITSMSFALTEEAQSGTLEQMFMGPSDSSVILLGRALATTLWGIFQIAVIGLALVLILRISLPLRWQGLPVLILTVLGLTGLGFIVGGLTLVFKHVNAFAFTVQNLLLFVNGALVPVSRLPDWLATFARLLPTTEGIIVLRNVLLNAQSLRLAWDDGSLSYLTLHSLVFFGGGLLFFKWCEHIARSQGSLGQY